MTELETLCAKIHGAARPKDVFGDLLGNTKAIKLKDLRKRYLQLGRAIHPDHNSGHPQASDAFVHLQQLYDQGISFVERGIYDVATASLLTVTTKRHTYEVGTFMGSCGVASVYACQVKDVLAEFHIAGVPGDNDLMANEAAMMRLLSDGAIAAGYARMLPHFIESLSYAEGSIHRTANVFLQKGHFVTLADVIKMYPDGVDPKDMAWIWRRLLDVLGYAHRKGIIHGSVIPPNILVGVGNNHEVVLRNWQGSVKLDANKTIPIIDPEYKSFYPKEVLEKDVPFHGTDLYTAAKSMLAFTDKSNPRFTGFLMSCAMPSTSSRNVSLWSVRSQFTELMDKTWPKREYRPLMLPN